jgi:hypothetical protein
MKKLLQCRIMATPFLSLDVVAERIGKTSCGLKDFPFSAAR